MVVFIMQKAAAIRFCMRRIILEKYLRKISDQVQVPGFSRWVARKYGMSDLLRFLCFFSFHWIDQLQYLYEIYC